jgi:hypothetical protein
MSVRVAMSGLRVWRVTGPARVTAVVMPVSVGVPVRRRSRAMPVSSQPAESHDAQTGRTKDQTC